MSRGTRIAALAGLIVLATLIAALVLAPWRATVLAGGAMAVLLLGVLEALGLAGGLGRTRSSPFEDALRVPASSTDRPEGLVHLEAALAWTSTSGRDFDRRARPELRALVRDRLLARHAVDLDERREAAEKLLGPELRALVRDPSQAGEGRAGRDGRKGSRVTNEQLARLLDRIEDL
jgi:hypothetical protein